MVAPQYFIAMLFQFQHCISC